jgi:hypothetical protein
MNKSYKSKKNLRNNTKKNNKYQKGGDDNIDKFVFITKNISSQQNMDTNYEEIGLVHLTDSIGINIVRNFATGVTNMFGSKGFDNAVYDYARNNALQKIQQKINENQKISNLRMEVSFDQTVVFVHLYGTLLQKKAV